MGIVIGVRFLYPEILV